VSNSAFRAPRLWLGVLIIFSGCSSSSPDGSSSKSLSSFPSDTSLQTKAQTSASAVKLSSAPYSLTLKSTAKREFLDLTPSPRAE
jgi:hypothetical protein